MDQTLGIRSCKGFSVTCRKEERPCLSDVKEKTTPENTLMRLFEREPECSHMLFAGLAFALFVWLMWLFSVEQAGRTQSLGLLCHTHSPFLGILGKLSTAKGHLQTFFFFFLLFYFETARLPLNSFSRPERSWTF